MKMSAILKAMVKGILVSLFIFSVFSAAAEAKPTIKRYSYQFDKIKKLFQTPAVNFAGGKIVVNGEVRQVDVSGGNGGCYTMTVNAYRIAPNGEKILVSTRSKQVCAKIDAPGFVFEDIPRSRIIIEVGIDKAGGLKEEKFKTDINVIYPSEMVNP